MFSSSSGGVSRVRMSLVLAACLLMASCKAELYSGLAEVEANNMMAILIANGIATSKVSGKEGFSIEVDENDTLAAIALLNDNGYVRRTQESNAENATVTQEVEIRDTGIILEVTPTINANDSVALDIKQSVSTPQPGKEADLTPVISTRDIESDILVHSGRTVLLAGLIQDRLEKHDEGVPVLRSVPIVKHLFKTDKDQIKRVELLVMITPRVTRNSSQIEGITQMLRSHFQTGVHMDPAVVRK